MRPNRAAAKARNASQALAATGWELRTFAIGRSLAKLERRRQRVDEKPGRLARLGRR
jgi:hypothetical protein